MTKLTNAYRMLEIAENNLRAATTHSRTATCMNEVARCRRLVTKFQMES